MVWAHVDRPSRIAVEYATTESFTNARRVTGSIATPDTGLTARAALGDLPRGPGHLLPRPLRGRRRPAHRQRAGGGEVPHRARRRPRRCGWPGRRTPAGRAGASTPRAAACASSRRCASRSPTCSSTSATPSTPTSRSRETVALDDGTVWRNLVTPAKSKVAETLDEFRGAHLYNRLDEHYRRFAAEVGLVAMWDDHEVRDNWYPTQVLGAQAPYEEKRVSVLAARARQAFLEHYPIAPGPGADSRIYRHDPLRSARRGVRPRHAHLSRREQPELQTSMSAETAFLGIGAGAMAGRRADGVQGDVEDRGRRHAARPHRRASARLPRIGRQCRRRRAARP